MLDFYIYGFKSQNDFTRKSSRTYDNERHLIESYLGEYMKWEYTKTGKSLFISMDCARIPVNPLYAAHTLEDGILLDRLYAIRNR